MLFRKVKFFTWLGFIVCITNGCSDSVSSRDEIVAIVEGRTITTDDIIEIQTISERQGKPLSQAQALQELINERLVIARYGDLLTDEQRINSLYQATEGLMTSKLEKDLPSVSKVDLLQIYNQYPARYAERKLYVYRQALVPSLPDDIRHQIKTTWSQAKIFSYLNEVGISVSSEQAALTSLLPQEMQQAFTQLNEGDVALFSLENEEAVIFIDEVIPLRLPFDDARPDLLKQYKYQQVKQKWREKVLELANNSDITLMPFAKKFFTKVTESQ